MAQVLAALRERGRPPAPPEEAVPPAPQPARRVAAVAGGRLALTLPGPRSAAVGVLSMLAFGVLVGSFAPRGIGDLVSAPVVLVMHGAGQVASSGDVPSSDAGGSSAGSSQVAQTITQTLGGGSSGGGGGGGGSVSYVTSSTSSTTTSSSSESNILGLPPIKHVFLIVLSGRGYEQTFAPGSTDRYLAKTLPARGALLSGYYAVAGSSAANGIALLTGQGPNQQTTAGCPQYTAFAPANRAKDGQYLGQGCVLPKTVPSLPAQLEAHNLTWRGYLQGFAAGAPKADAFGCRRPAAGAADAAAGPRPGEPYSDARNPFLYLAAVTGSSDCQDNLGDLSAMKSDLTTAAGTPSLSYIVPDACHDGSGDPGCGAASVQFPLRGADAFLQATVAQIQASPAYRADGLIAITFDQAPQSGLQADRSACCSTPQYPNLPTPAATTSSPALTSSSALPGATSLSTSTTTTATETTTDTSTSSAAGGSQTTPTGGGGQVGLVLISRYIKPGTLDVVDDYNHYSLLASLENIFGLPRLGYGAQLGLPVLDAGVFNATP